MPQHLSLTPWELEAERRRETIEADFGSADQRTANDRIGRLGALLRRRAAPDPASVDRATPCPPVLGPAHSAR